MSSTCRISASLVALACLLTGMLPTAAQPGSRDVTIVSDPPGARVFVLKGFKQEPIGLTPLEHAFIVQSERSIIRIRVEKSGYRARTLNVSGEDANVLVELEAISLLGEASADARLDASRDDLFAAFAPWSPEGPAEVMHRDNRRLLAFSLESSEQRPTVADSGNVASRVAKMLDRSDTQRVDGIVLTFAWRSSAGVSTSVGTRIQTQMVCEGAMVPTSVWDSCATRNSTTSTTSLGTKTEYYCVGGMVTRSVWNGCAKRVPKQQHVVDLKQATGAGTHENAIVQVLEAQADGFRRAGHCEYRNGKLVGTSGETSSELVRATCL